MKNFRVPKIHPIVGFIVGGFFLVMLTTSQSIGEAVGLGLFAAIFIAGGIKDLRIRRQKATEIQLPR